jgi:ketosteroid isomerase-like protein
MSDSEKFNAQVEALIYAYFEAGKNKDLGSIEGLHADERVFTKFDEFPPYERQNLKQAVLYEQAAFANMTDYQYKIEGLRIDIFYPCAVATFCLEYSGVFVNDYSFEGKPIHSRSRVTMVLLRIGQDWKIVHEHFSPFPDWPHRRQKVGP